MVRSIDLETVYGLSEIERVRPSERKSREDPYSSSQRTRIQGPSESRSDFRDRQSEAKRSTVPKSKSSGKMANEEKYWERRKMLEKKEAALAAKSAIEKSLQKRSYASTNDRDRTSSNFLTNQGVDSEGAYSFASEFVQALRSSGSDIIVNFNFTFYSNDNSRSTIDEWPRGSGGRTSGVITRNRTPSSKRPSRNDTNDLSTQVWYDTDRGTSKTGEWTMGNKTPNHEQRKRSAQKEKGVAQAETDRNTTAGYSSAPGRTSNNMPGSGTEAESFYTELMSPDENSGIGLDHSLLSSRPLTTNSNNTVSWNTAPSRLSTAVPGKRSGKARAATVETDDESDHTVYMGDGGLVTEGLSTSGGSDKE